MNRGTSRPRQLSVSRRVSGEVMLIATVIMWALGFTTARFAVTHGFQPLQYSAPRFVLGALVFVVVALIREGTLRFERRDLPYIVPAALLGVTINQVAFNYAVKFASASTVAIVFGTLPIFGAILAAAMGWERIRGRHWLATAVSFAGVALVAIGSGGDLSGDLGGILLALGASLTFAAFSVSVAPLMQRYSAARVSATVTVVGTVPLVLISIPQLVSADWGRIESLAWGALAYQLAMFVVTTYLWLIAIDRVGAGHATLWANLQPFAGAVAAVLILSETMAPVQVAGAVVLASAIALARWRRPPSPILD